MESRTDAEQSDDELHHPLHRRTFRRFVCSLKSWPFGHGAYGAKGIGELPMDGPAPAILNAIAHATGEQFDSVPLLPEDIFRQMVVRELEQEAVAQ